MKEHLAAQDVHAEIEREAKAKAVAEVRMVEKIEIGQAIRQGDIYVHRVSPSHPHGRRLQSRQLAIGESQGSRHVAELPADVYEGTQLPPTCDRRTFLGPCIVAPARFTIVHPEHAHFSLPEGTYQVTHQTDAKTMERVID
jgi:hypothetical protein